MQHQGAGAGRQQPSAPAGGDATSRAPSPEAATPSTGTPGIIDYGLLLLLAAIWGGSFLLIRIGVKSVPPLTLTTIRLLVASAFMVGLAFMLGERMRAPARTWGLILLAAITGNALPFFLISWGQQRVESGLAAILMGIMPLTTYLLAHLVTRDEKLTLFKAIGVGLGLLGVIVLIGPGKLASLGQDTVRQLAIAAAAFCYGLNAMIARGLTGVPRHALVAILMVMSLAMTVPTAFLVDGQSGMQPTFESLLAIVILGVLQTAIGTVLMYMIVARRGASFFSQINFLVPVLGVAWGALFLAERPSANAFVALALILSGIAAARLGTSLALQTSGSKPKG